MLFTCLFVCIIHCRQPNLDYLLYWNECEWNDFLKIFWYSIHLSVPILNVQGDLKLFVWKGVPSLLYNITVIWWGGIKCSWNDVENKKKNHSLQYFFPAKFIILPRLVIGSFLYNELARLLSICFCTFQRRFRKDQLPLTAGSDNRWPWMESASRRGNSF